MNEFTLQEIGKEPPETCSQVRTMDSTAVDVPLCRWRGPIPRGAEIGGKDNGLGLERVSIEKEECVIVVC